MTLLLNYRPVLRQPTGIGVYGNAVLPALQELTHVLVPGGEAGTAKQRLKRLVWTQLALPRVAKRHKASLIFTPAPEGYLGPQIIPQVVMVHDLRPISHSERSVQSLYFRSWVPPLLKSSRHVLTNSYFTAREIQRCTGLADSHITVTHLGYDEQLFKPGPSREISQERPYFLHVGQPYPHKNLRRLVQAFSQLAASYPEVQLVLAGKPHPTETPILKALVLRLRLEKRVEFRSYVPYEKLPDLYRGAAALVYPSLWEGFGLPILEAMACGTPVITSSGSGTEEVAGGAALLVDPMSAGEIADAMRTMLSCASSSFRALALRRVTAFSWDCLRAKTVTTLLSIT